MTCLRSMNTFAAEDKTWRNRMILQSTFRCTKYQVQQATFQLHLVLVVAAMQLISNNPKAMEEMQYCP